MNTEYRIVFVTSKSTNTEYRIVFVTSKSANTEYRIVLFGPNYSRIPNNRIIRCNSVLLGLGLEIVWSSFWTYLIPHQCSLILSKQSVLRSDQMIFILLQCVVILKMLLELLLRTVKPINFVRKNLIQIMLMLEKILSCDNV